MTAIAPIELRELVNSPVERLDVEYKSWLNLSGEQHEARASLARHIAALANHGGGYVVFGIDDQMNYAGINRDPNTQIDRELVASIVKRYLEPTFQCNVYEVRSTLGNGHPVIFVPPHSAFPISAKADGPKIDGKVKGISRGTYYTTKAGPESAAILNPVEWAPIIRRCVLHERSALLGALDVTLSSSGGNPFSGPNERALLDELRAWHDAARAKFLQEAEKSARSSEAEVPPELARRYYQFSYRAKINHERILDALREINCEVAVFSKRH